MAFQKQFKTSYVSYNGWDYYLEIWVNATAGTITASEIKLGTGGPIISYDTDNEDRFSPIISSNCVIPLVIESSVQENFVKQLREVYNERDVYVHLYKATEAQHSSVKPLWSGFVLMDLSSTPDEFYPYDFKITAVDGLGLLKDIDFVETTTRRANEYLETDMYYGPGRYTFWIKEILLKSGASTTTEGASEDYVFTTAINWYESQMPTITQSLDPFFITKCSVGMFHTKTDNGVFEVTNCYEVLKELLKHWGARMTYWKGQFWIVQIPQYITPDSGTYINPDNIDTRTYDKTGSFISSSDNLGDSFYTRYQLNIGDLTGGIQKLTGTEVNYLPQIRETRANNISFGNGNRYGGFPREFTGNSAPSEIIFQDQINDASASDSFNLVIPLNVTVENGNPFFMKILFNFYCTDLTDTYYLQYNPTLTHKYYWVSSTQWTTLVNAPVWDSGFTAPVNGNSNQNQSHSNLVGFDQNILFKLYNTSTQAFSNLDLSGDFKFYLDIDAYGTSISDPGSFRFKFANASLSGGQFFYPTHPSINVSWTNTLQSNYALQTPNIITNNAPNGNSIIQLTTPNIDPFEGMFVVITNTTGSIYGNSYVASVNTTDVAIVDFGTLIWGDTLQISDLGCLQVFNGSTFVKSSSSGNWGNGILTGSLAFTQILLDEYLYGQTKVIESPSMRLVTSVLNRDSSDGSGLRPNFINPIGRLKESRTNLSDVQYVFKRGAFYTLTDEWDYEGFEIRRDVSSVITTVKEITGPNNPVTGVGSVPRSPTIPNAFGQIISKQIITSLSSSVAAGAITSLPIALINDVVFKVGDFFNVLNSDTNEFIKFELNGQQFSDSSALTVVSQTITDNIPANSIITFNAFDLTSQYQNKTRGTVGAFDITATSIDSGSVAISSYIDDDTFATASVNSLSTSESIKAYVDGQAGLTENLQTVTNNGNTTTNSITIGNAASPNNALEVYGNADNGVARFRHTSNGAYGSILLGSVNRLIGDVGTYMFKNGSSELMRLTSGGNLLLGTTTDSGIKLVVNSGTNNVTALFESTNAISEIRIKDDSAYTRLLNSAFTFKIMPYNGVEMMALDGNNEDITIPTYAGTNQTGTATYLLGTDANGKILKTTTIPSGSGGPFLPLAGGTLTGDLNLGTTSAPVDLYLFGDTAGTSLTWSNSDDELQFSDNTKVTFGDSGDLQVYYDGVDGAIKSATGIQFLANSATKMSLTSGGNLGIGTSSPSAILHTKVTSGESLRLQAAEGSNFIRFTDASNNSVAYIGQDNIFTINNQRNTDMRFNTNNSEKVRITAGGNLGIGTTSNSAEETNNGVPKLQVNTATAVLGEFPLAARFTTASDAGDNSGVSVLINSGNDRGLMISAGRADGNRSKATLNLVSFDGNELLDGITLYQPNVGSTGATTGTNVGINQVNPTEKLHVVGDALITGDSHADAFKPAATGEPIKFKNFGSTELARITNGGELCVGYTSNQGLTAKFLVNGNAYFSGNILPAGGILIEDGSSATPSIRFNNDTDTGLFRDTANSVGVAGGLNVTGNVLLGITVDSGKKLQINGDIKIHDSANSAKRIFFERNSLDIGSLGTNNSKLTLKSLDNKDISIEDDSGNGLIVKNGGNVLIGGTSDNGQKLQVTGGGTFSGDVTLDKSSGSSPSLNFINGSDDNGAILINSSGKIQIKTGGTVRQTISSGDTEFNGNIKLVNGSGNVTFASSSSDDLTVTSTTANFSGNLLLKTTTDVGVPLYVNGIIRTTGGSVQAGQDYGFTLQDESNNNRYGLKFGVAGSVGGSNLLMLTNRSLSSASGGGEVAIGANASTTGVTETEVMRIKAVTQSQVSIDGVLSLTKQDTPVDPPNNASTIWLDSNWDLKIKITNSSGDTVTKTIVEYA